jgi:hypothetical protein
VQGTGLLLNELTLELDSLPFELIVDKFTIALGVPDRTDLVLLEGLQLGPPLLLLQ